MVSRIDFLNMRFDPNSKIARAKMRVQLTDLMRAIDDIEHVSRKIFDDFLPLYDNDERIMKCALAVLHEHIRELNQ